ncbi:MAG: MFS transporter [Opitutaceae bacterium]|nr:MFS transporter [Opitutaceae bacterium]
MERSATAVVQPPVSAVPVEQTVLPVLLALSLSHMLNDMIQALLPAIYPVLKQTYALNFAQVGMITLAFQATASLLQPAVGFYTDRKPLPYSLALGMGVTLLGLVLLASTATYPLLLVAAALVGTGSSIFHPEASRLARLASGGRHGFAQSLFQVGGNFGTALGPLLAAAVILPATGQRGALWFIPLAVLGIVVLSRLGRWYQAHLDLRRTRKPAAPAASPLPPRKVYATLALLGALIFSKHFYLASLGSYYTFFLMGKFGFSVREAQLRLFVFLFSVAAGTILGGPLGDHFGRKRVIWFSILGVAPFTLVLPYANAFWTVVLTVPIGVILASAFPAILVYGQELLPGKVGLVAGMFFGFAFGIAAVGAALLGHLADHAGIEYVYRVCSFLPLIGLLTVFLPDLRKPRAG